MSVEPAHYPNRAELTAAVRLLFGDRADDVMGALDRYDEQRLWKECRERVQMAIVGLSEGTLERIHQFVDEANHDYRNVLYWYEYTKAGVSLRQALEIRLGDAGLRPWR